MRTHRQRTVKTIRAGRWAALAVATLLTGTIWAGGTIDAEEVRQMQLDGEPFLLVDVRPTQQFESGHAEGALNMPAFSLRHRSFPAGTLVVLYDDGVGSVEAEEAAAALESAGHTNYRILDGGLHAWDLQRYPAVRPRGVTDAPLVPWITPEKLERLIGGERAGSVTLVDVRSAEKYREGRLPGAVNVDPARLTAGLRDVSKQNIVIVYDDGSGEDREAAEKLRREGYSVRILYGGFQHWAAGGREVSR